MSDNEEKRIATTENYDMEVSDGLGDSRNLINVKEELIKNEHGIKVELEYEDMDEDYPEFDTNNEEMNEDYPECVKIKVDPLFEERDVYRSKPPSSCFAESAEDCQTAKELLDMVDRWGLVKWEQLKGRKLFDEFWEFSAVQDARRAVCMNYLTKVCGADLLGIQIFKNRGGRFDTDRAITADIPEIIQDLVVMWAIVTKEEYKIMGKTINQFWKETFIRKILYSVQKEFLSDLGGAQLLGVSESEIIETRQVMFGRRPACHSPRMAIFGRRSAMISPLQSLKESVAMLESQDIKVEKVEDMNNNWWGSNVPVKGEKMFLEDISISRTWIVFLQFSQLEIQQKKVKFNPYRAGGQMVSDFLQFVQLTKSWSLLKVPNPETCLACLAVCLPDISLPAMVVELMSSHPPTLGAEDVNMTMVILPVSPYKSTWNNFSKFCTNSVDDIIPYQAKPVLVRDFLVSKFEGKEMRLKELQPKKYMNLRNISYIEKESFFRPAHNFYRDNVERLLSEMDWHLQYSWLTGPLRDSKEMESLLQAAVCCDERLHTGDPELTDLVLKISFDDSFTKVMVNNPEDLFWGRRFTENVLSDVRSGSLPRSVAASGLGVTAEMVMFAIKEDTSVKDKFNDHDNPTGVISVKDYVLMGFGSQDQFWTEQSMVYLLEEVGMRNVTVEWLAAFAGVSRMEIIERCGGVREKAEMEAEKTLAFNEKTKQEAENKMKFVKIKSQLEIQIEMAEKNEDSLTGYEKMRLENMRERQAMLESLDFDKEKKELFDLTPRPRNKPGQVMEIKPRDKSARIKRRSEIEQLKKPKTVRDCTIPEWTKLQNSRSSPKWFGHWVPRSHGLTKASKEARAILKVDLYDVYDEEAINNFNHIPKFDLRVQELLEISPAYHKSRILLDSFSEDFKQVRVEEKLEAKSDWSKFKVLQDNMVSINLLSSLDSCNDFICFGTKAGGVGVALAGRSFTIRPHNREVTRTLFIGNNSSVGVLSAALDGTVRMTDLVQQSVCLEYSWDQSYSVKQGVNWLEGRDTHNFLLDCGIDIKQIDIRSKDVHQLFEVDKGKVVTKLSVNPVNENLVSVSRDNSVQIWDLRKAREAVVTLPGHGDTVMAGGGWSSGGTYFVTSVEGNWANSDVTVVYNGRNFSKILNWEGARFSPSTAATWCPWEETLFFTSMEMREHGSTKQGVVAVDCTSGEVVGELSSGLDNSKYLVHCSKSREMVVVGNSKGPGGLAIFGIPY